MTAPLEIWFEFASTYSYLGIHQVAPLLGCVHYRPFLLGPVFAAQGMRDSPFNLYPVKGQYMWRDMERLCEQAGLPFKRPSAFPRNGLLAARVATASLEATWMPAFCRSVYRANFGEDREVGERSVIAELLSEVGADPAVALEQAETPANKQALRAQTERAIALGVFGAPTFVVNGELFWGSDRFEQALHWRERSCV